MAESAAPLVFVSINPSCMMLYEMPRHHDFWLSCPTLIQWSEEAPTNSSTPIICRVTCLRHLYQGPLSFAEMIRANALDWPKLQLVAEHKRRCFDLDGRFARLTIYILPGM